MRYKFQVMSGRNAAAWTTLPAADAVTTRVFYDRAARRLIYLRHRADSDSWDRRWTSHPVPTAHEHSVGQHRCVSTTARYLRRGERVLEGGCGRGEKLTALAAAGFQTCGVDFAPETLRRSRRRDPRLPLVLGDVRTLPLLDSCLDGYWSVGVIEHDYDGYDAMASEMGRVLRQGGYLFLTFPAMSLSRRILARCGLYPRWHEQMPRADFYQFVLSADAVRAHFTSLGFKLVDRVSLGGLRGLKEMAPAFHRLLRRLYHHRHRSHQRIKAALDRMLAPWTGHSALLILQLVSNPPSA
jgi:SAM-dependent methyltransferase